LPEFKSRTPDARLRPPSLGTAAKLVDEGYGGWETVAPSAIAFADDYPMPREMTKEDIEKATEDFVRRQTRG
jgi:2,4-dienoyl-CoA reductase-like NADH-dependent reductase (Old Yellow Enzyme family)